MRTSEHESPQRVRDVVDVIFDRRLTEALSLIRSDIDELDAHFSPSQINEALLLALFRAKVGGAG